MYLLIIDKINKCYILFVIIIFIIYINKSFQ